MRTYRVTFAYVGFTGEHFSRTASVECHAPSAEDAQRIASDCMPLTADMAHTITVEQVA